MTEEVFTRHVASTRFEAARQLSELPDGDKFSRLHGHGFLVSVHATDTGAQTDSVETNSVTDQISWPPYRGGEVPAMLAALQGRAQRLDYQSLNEVLAEPSDGNLARWFEEGLQVLGRCAVSLQSTPEQGVVVGERLRHNSTLVWRRYRFQAAHQLPNVAPGHKCGRMHGHGFEVVLYAVSVDAVVSYDTLDRAWATVSDELSHRCLNEVPGLENPTSELLSSWLWQRLRPVLPTLSAVTVYETASCGATYDGQHYRIWKDFTIDSAVRYRHAVTDTGLTDPRSRLHGYTYTLRLNLCAPLDQVMGWTVDFGDVKEVFTPVFKSLDHHPLHENPELSSVSDGDTGSIARWLFNQTQNLLPSLVRVDLYENEGCGSSVGTDLNGPVLPLIRVS